MKKSGTKTPRIELEDMGPSIDFTVRRTQLASDDFYKRALKVPVTATVSLFLRCFKSIASFYHRNL